MSYEVAHLDELESLPVNNGEFTWRPVRRRFGISAFGTNAYTGDRGKRVIEEHHERDGHEEMYVVLRGRATFALGDDEVDAPAGTLVFVQPGTRRGAVGEPERARRVMDELVAKYPNEPQGHYNYACLEVRLGDNAAALRRLQRAAELDLDLVKRFAENDSDLDPIRNEPGFPV